MAHTLLYKNQKTYPVSPEHMEENKKIEREVAYFDFQRQIISKSKYARNLRIKVFRFLEAHKCHSNSDFYDKLV